MQVTQVISFRDCALTTEGRLAMAVRKFKKGLAEDDGWMLTEGVGSILFYLIMIGVAAGILFFLFSSSKLTQMQQAVSTMSMQIQGLYSGASEYTGLDNSLAIKSGVVPRKLLKGTSIKTPWGGDVTLAPGTDTGTFTIKLAGIKQEDCTKLAAYQLDMWQSVDVNGTEFNTDSGVSGAVNACVASNTITYTSR